MRKLTLLAVAIAACVTMAWSAPMVNPDTKKEYTPDESVVYKSTPQGDLELHIFYPNGEKKGKNRTVVVQFFGGGWAAGNPNQFYQQSAFFNQHGIVGISVDYRVIQKHKTTPFECVEDAKSAVRWVRQNAKKLGIDPNKIVTSGGSAGGHLAICTAIIEGYEADGEKHKVSSVPNATILFNPVLDTTEKGYGAEKVKGQETAISPTHHVREGIVPTLVMHGTKDTTVPFANADDFVVAMKKCGNNCELIIFEGKNHGFFNGAYFRARNGDADFNRCMSESLKFIEGLGF